MYEACRELMELKHTRIIYDDVKEFMTFMLQLSTMPILDGYASQVR